MDNSSVFQSMLDKAIVSEASAFTNFDRTKNVQDQLQEMIDIQSFNVPNGFTRAFLLATEFGRWVNSNTFPYTPSTMEQLWLAFVMLTLYHKKWYNGEWRSEDDKDNASSETTP